MRTGRGRRMNGAWLGEVVESLSGGVVLCCVVCRRCMRGGCRTWHLWRWNLSAVVVVDVGSIVSLNAEEKRKNGRYKMV